MLPIVLGTIYGPILRTPLFLSVSELETILALDAPPDEAIKPVIGFETSFSSNPDIEMQSNIKDKNYRIYVNDDGIHLFNKNIYKVFTDPFDFYEHLEISNDSGHAFYLGVELARAQIAYQLKKEYQQDEELAWGCLVDKKVDNKLQSKELGPTFKKRK